MQTPLRGIIPPLVMPLLDRDTLDVAGLERRLEHVLAGGVSGVFILGSTGEAPCLGYRLRRDLVDRVCRSVAGRVPVLVGITDTAFVESVSLAHHAAAEGADMVVAAPPFYFPVGQPELIDFVEHLAVELPLPLLLYNMPQFTRAAWWQLASIFSGGRLELFLLGRLSRHARSRHAATGVAFGVPLILWMTLSPGWTGALVLASWRSPFHANLIIVLGTLVILVTGPLAGRLRPAVR